MDEPPDESRLDLSFLLNQAAYAFEARLADALAELGLSVREYCVLWKADEDERTQNGDRRAGRPRQDAPWS